jgi:excisionase family DNA binding protein
MTQERIEYHPQRVLLTVNQTAELLSISDDQVYRLLRRGELTSFKIGRLRRIPRAAVDTWIDQQIAQQEGGLG